MNTQRLALGLLILAGLVALVGPAVEARQRAPEATVRAYLEAVERRDLTAALATIAPEQREALRPPVEHVLGSSYRVEVLALGRPSLLDRARGAPSTRAWATLLAEVRPVIGQPWKTTSRAELVERDGRWYLLNAPLT